MGRVFAATRDKRAIAVYERLLNARARCYLVPDEEMSGIYADAMFDYEQFLRASNAAGWQALRDRYLRMRLDADADLPDVIAARGPQARRNKAASSSQP